MKLNISVNAEASPLTPAENKVYALVAGGFSRREISAMLYREHATVSTHIQHIKAKLDARSATQAVTIGFVRGILKQGKTLAIYGVLFCNVGFGLLPADALAAGSAPPVQRVRGGGVRLRVSGVKLTRRREGAA